MDKPNPVNPPDGLSLGINKEQTTDIAYNVDKPTKHHAKVKEVRHNKHRSCHPICMRRPEAGKRKETGSRFVPA